MTTDLSIYTITHSDDVSAAQANGGRGTYTERKKCVRAEQFMDAAKQPDKGLSVIFAAAEGTSHLFGWALVDEIVPAETRSDAFSELRLIDPQPHKSTQKKASDGVPLDDWFTRRCAICQTLDNLPEQATASGGD